MIILLELSYKLSLWLNSRLKALGFNPLSHIGHNSVRMAKISILNQEGII